MNNTLCPVITGILFQILSLQTFAAEPDFETIIASRFSKIWHTAPQEKVYLHTDKPYYYSAGDDIWFSAHLVNASTHKPDTRSQFVYVELIDQSDSVLTRVKIKRDTAGIAGKITIPPAMPPGEYLLRAYTFWMLNGSSDFFFHKKISIGNMIDDRVRLSTTFGTPENGKIPVVITLKNTFSTPLSGKKVAIKEDDRKTSQHITNQLGEIHLLIKNDSTSRIKNILEVSLREPGLNFNRKIQLPDIHDDYDVRFFPESGVFLDNQLQTIAFKAIGTDGLSRNVSGKIYTRENKEISEFRTMNNGMGKIIIKTIPGEQYYASVTNESGLEKKILLPETSSEGISLKLRTVNGKIFLQFINQTNIETKDLFLLIHARGIVYHVSSVNGAGIQISEELLPPGICSFSIIDKAGNTWCERLCFVRNANFPTVTMQSNKNKYGQRDPVELAFRVVSNDSLPARGSYSVSVTDSHLVDQDSINNNILSYFLLSSDLKGYIEKPQQYFADNSRLTQENTDLLMLTQGWRRFNTNDVVKGVLPKTDYYLEIGQTVSGKVINLFNKPVKNAEVIFFSNYKNQITTGKTDTTGQFIIDGIDFPDSTHIFLKAKSNSKIVDVELIPNEDIFPTSRTNFPFTPDKLVAEQEDYLHLSKERYYNEGGMMVINLDEFTVEGETRKPDNALYYSGSADNSLDSENLKSFGNQTVLDIIRTFPGVLVSGDRVSIRGATGNPLFLIDGVVTEELEDVQFLNAFDIEEISLFKSASASLFGLRGGNGVIAITLKKGVQQQNEIPSSLAHYTPLGYQKPAEFYVPKYEVDSIRSQSKPDLRTTIYWNPDAKTDEEGNIRLKFYTADKANNYRVKLEGVSNNGEICNYEGIIKRE
ncbi:MAG: TonB-dependent receptor plug domain-containing protein [Paludibacter sp.]|nr:TonB-dependent receptor plug domain-containing protein [Paludibacter sp.]MDD4198203.1 TonB-dependent receptor plug domain-containing protein [Paludibacter sp.]MDD4427326.1 TonB-dependent receptor plug domain-containing protein [Paludibacter sp.]